MARHCTRGPKNTLETDPVLRLWLLRILVPLGGYRQFVEPEGFRSDALACAVGLGHWLHKAPAGFDPGGVIAELRQLHRRAERRWGKVPVTGCLRANARRLSDLVGLGSVDCRILEFAVSIHSDRLLDDTADFLGQLTSARLFEALSVILGLPAADVRDALAAQGLLARSGLVSVDRARICPLRGKLDLLSDAFADLMATSEADPVGLLRGIVSCAGPGHLALDDYRHVAPMLDILLPYLRQAARVGRPGVNVFLYGPPGTGKTQLTRLLAAELGCELFEVASEDADGDPVDGERRLRAFRASQGFFAQRRALIAFEEVEDVFDDGNRLFGRKSTAQVRKAWLNRMLEENPVPTIWLSNAIDALDAAFIRRFDMVFELPVPPRSQRARILHAHCGDLLDTATVNRLAGVEGLAPAVVARAASVVRAVRDEHQGVASAEAFERLIGTTLEAQGHGKAGRGAPCQGCDTYDPLLVNADADLDAIAGGLATAGSGRLCLYGPPGTGKSAYGRWLAQRMGVPLLVRRASDLMGMLVGESERSIAAAFRQAEREGALLLIDEVDSFLRDRRSARQGWEVTLVNEMLTQIEAFPGVFVASTNLMEGLDQAALRRFDLKLQFAFLRADQAANAFLQHCQTLGLGAPDPDLVGRVMRLQRLTPGDFAAVRKQHRFRPLGSAGGLVAALESECALKEGPRRSIGFH